MAEKIKTKRVSKENIEFIKKELPAILESNPIMSFMGITVKLGFRCRNTLWAAAKEDPEIKKILDKYVDARRPTIEDLVKDTWYHRLIKGKGHPSEYIFFMMNHFPDEYKDMRISRNMNLNGVVDDKNFRDEFFGLGKQEQGEIKK